MGYKLASFSSSVVPINENSNSQFLPGQKLSSMSGLHLFHGASMRSFEFFSRTLEATKQCFEHFRERKKRPVNMAPPTDDDVIEFFTRERIREEKKHAQHGEVPEVFRTHHFSFTVEGENWVQSSKFQGSLLYVRVYIKKREHETFTFLFQTETIRDQRSPSFIARAHFCPLAMENSQNHAMNTIVRIDPYVNDKRVASVHVCLAELLWDMSYVTTMESFCPSPISHRPNTRSRLKLNLSRGRSIEEDIDSCEIKFKVQLSREVWARTKESSLFLTVCSVSGYGEWSHMYSSELLVKPFKKANSGQFMTFKLGRGDLICYDPTNPIRIGIRGSGRGNSKLHGFVQFVLPKFSTLSFLPWNYARSSRLSASVVLRADVSADEHSVLCLYIGTSVADARALVSNETERDIPGRRKRLLPDTKLVAAKKEYSYDRSGNSSESSEGYLSPFCSKKGEWSLLRDPKYVVRFPSQPGN